MSQMQTEAQNRTQRAQAIITTAESLIAATKDTSVRQLIIEQDLEALPTIALLPGQELRSKGARSTLTFLPDSDGLQVSANNCVVDIDLRASSDKRALFNSCEVTDIGRIELRNISTVGRVQILAADKVRAGHIEINGLDIISADTLSEVQRPHEYGVEVLQGAFTLWNLQPDPEVILSANLIGLSAGRLGAPVLGSGIFVGGAGEKGGRVNIQHLETEAVYIDGKIAPGTPDQISGGVFTVYGAYADVVVNHGPVVTYGTNDMALDNWGVVDRWIAKQKILTLGASGIGFVNFGKLGELRVEAPIETYGQGARGFNVYAGTVEVAQFDRILTHGDGAVRVQISQPIGELRVARGIETLGGSGESLVKGKLKYLSAVALSIMPGASARSVVIEGGLKTNGKDIAPLEQHGSIDTLKISGGFVAVGDNS